MATVDGELVNGAVADDPGMTAGDVPDLVVVDVGASEIGLGLLQLRVHLIIELMGPTDEHRMVAVHLIVCFCGGHHVAEWLGNSLRRHDAERWERIREDDRLTISSRILALDEILPGALDRTKHKPPVLDERTAKRSTELLPVVRGLRKPLLLGEVIDSRHGIVSAKEESAAMQLIRP